MGQTPGRWLFSSWLALSTCVGGDWLYVGGAYPLLGNWALLRVVSHLSAGWFRRIPVAEARKREGEKEREREREAKSFLRPGLRTGATSLLPYSIGQSKSQGWARFRDGRAAKSHTALGKSSGEPLTGASVQSACLTRIQMTSVWF